MTLLSQRAYAKHRGLSEAAIRNAIKRGQITRNEEGKIDLALADKEWNDYIKQNAPHVKAGDCARSPKSKVKSTMQHIYIEQLIIQVPDLPFDPDWQRAITQKIEEEEKAHFERARKTIRGAFFRGLGGE